MYFPSFFNFAHNPSSKSQQISLVSNILVEKKLKYRATFHPWKQSINRFTKNKAKNKNKRFPMNDNE